MIVDNPDLFAQARLSLHEKIARCKLNTAERWCLLFIRERSFDIGRTRAWIPRQRYFCDRTGLYKPDVSKTLPRLKRMLVITEEPAGLYGINVLFDNWKVHELAGRGQILMDLDGGPVPDLNEALRMTFVELGQRRVVEISPTRDTGTSLVVHPGRMDQSGGDVCPEGSEGGMSGRSAGPQPGSARREPGVSPSAPTGGDPQEDGEAAAMGPQVSKSLTSITGASPDGVSKSLTTAIPANKERAGMGVVSESLTPGPGAALVSPQTPLVQNRYGTGTGAVRPLQEAVEIKDLAGTERAREGVSESLTPEVSKSLTTRRINYAEDRRLMALLAECFSGEKWKNEMKTRGEGFWLIYVVRNFPRELEQALAELRYMEHVGYPFICKPALLTRKVAVLAGVKCWSAIRPVYDNPRRA